MKPASFDYFDPRSAEEALSLLARHGSEARLLAGGQSLVARLNLRLATPSVIVDLNRIGELSYVRQENGRVAFGAMTRQRQIQTSSLVAEAIPLLVDAVRLVGHLPTRTRGTIGGSIAHADPAAEIPTVAAALDAELVVRGPSARRVLRPPEFFRGPLATALEPDEMLVEIRLPVMPARSGWAFEEVSLRGNHFALAEAAVQLTLDGGGRCAQARVAVGGSLRPLRLREVEAILERDGVDEPARVAAATRAAEIVETAADIHASADYRRRLVRTLVGRALARATAVARGKEEPRV